MFYFLSIELIENKEKKSIKNKKKTYNIPNY